MSRKFKIQDLEKKTKHRPTVHEWKACTGEQLARP